MLFKFTNTSNAPVTVMAEGQAIDLTPGSSVAADFATEEITAVTAMVMQAVQGDKSGRVENVVSENREWVAKLIDERGKAERAVKALA